MRKTMKKFSQILIIIVSGLLVGQDAEKTELGV